MKKFMIIALFPSAEKKEIIEAMDETEALDKWGIDNEFKYEYVTHVIELSKNE